VTNARHQVAARINNLHFDSIILGTSVTENFSAGETSKKLGGKFANLSIGGGDFVTRSLILEYALKRKNLKKILYSLDDMGLVAAEMGDVKNFDFLYDDNKPNDLRIYFSSKYFFCFFYEPICLSETDPDRPNAWHENVGHTRRFGGLDNWFKAKTSPQVKEVFRILIETKNQLNLGRVNIENNHAQMVSRSQRYLDHYLIRHIEHHPGTEFALILPPKHRLQYAIDAQYNVSKFDRYSLNVKYLVKKSNRYPNLKLYGWGNRSFVDNFANYKDLGHWNDKIDLILLDDIQQHRALLTSENVDDYLQIFKQKALNYDLHLIATKVEKHFDTN